MKCLTVGAASLTRQAGGIAYQVMQLQAGAYAVCLDIKLDDGTSMLEGLRLLELESGLS
jgi:hypothetical protein